MRAALLVLVSLVVLAPDVRAEPSVTVRVIVSTSITATRLDRQLVSDAFLKKRTRWDDDSAILPVDRRQDSQVRDVFSRKVLRRDVVSVRRYWAQLVFSGRGVPPPELDSDQQVVKYVSSHPGAIGYVSSAAELSGVHVVEVE